MASEDRDSFPDGIPFPLPPKLKKRKVISDSEICVICQADLPGEPLRKGKEYFIEKAIRASVQRHDEEVRTRLVNYNPDIGVHWHSNCYASFTSEQNIRYTTPLKQTSGQDEDVVVSSRTFRSGMTPVDWSKCLICKNKTYKKSRDLSNVCTFEACQSIRLAAERKGDSSMLHILNGVNGDLIAAEAKYHKNCFATYVSKKSTLSLAKGEAGNLPHESAFQELVIDLAAGIEQGRAYDMVSLLGKYRDILTQEGAANPESYTTQNLKIRLQKHFSSSIVFHQPADRSKSELVYSSSVNVQDILNAWAVFQPPAKGNESVNDVTLPSSEIYHIASLIKQEIKKCTGIPTKPLNTQDVSMETARQLIPDCLYLLIRLLVTSGKHRRPSDALSQSTNMEDERQILSIAQDIIHCNTKGRVKLPKHTSLAMCVHHLTSSKRLIELLNRMGHCVSYDEMRAVNTSIAEEVLAKVEAFGTVIPTNIKPGTFVQIAADNNDLNEETLDGKNTTHVTTMVIYQNKTFGPDPPPNLVEQRAKRRSLQATGTVYDIEECPVRGRRPAVNDHVGSVDMEWYKDTNDEIRTSRNAEFIWGLLRFCPKKFGEAVIAEVMEKQAIPSWAGFNAILYPEMPIVSNVGYCPMVNGSSNDYSIIYTVLKHAQKISATMGQADTVITFDLAIYSKAKEIQWRFPDEFADVVVRLGGFHIALNFLSLLGKKFADSGLDDLLIESGVYAAGSTSALMKGKSYNRGIRAHKLCLEVFFRLKWNAFLVWYESQDKKIPEEPILRKIVDCVRTVENGKENARESVRKIETDLTELVSLFGIFKTENQGKSKLFAFWDEYGCMVTSLLQFLKAERTGNWRLHLSSVAAMLPHFFAMDRQNYSRYLPVYLAYMQRLEVTHPEVYNEFAAGNHSISRTGQPFSQVSTDMAPEQSINADSKSSGGVIGISQSPSALERWFLTIHERASITSALKAMYGIQDGEKASHKEAAPRRIKRDEEDVKKMMGCFSSGLMTDPFTQDSDALLNIATGVVLPEDVAQNLVRSTEKGRQQMNSFVKERINSNAMGFWEPIPNMKIKTFSSANKEIRVKSSDKLVTINADRDLFGRLLIVSNTRQICLKDVLSFELSPVPYSLANADGSLRKGAKCVLCPLLEKDVNVVQRLTASPNPTVVIIDGMAVIQMSRSAGASTFGELSEKYYNIFSAPLFSNNCEQVHVVFDQYWENSIKGGERQRRGASVGLEVQIGGPTTPVPRQWGKYISNPKNKVWVKLLKLLSFTFNTNFLVRYWQFEVVIDICCV